MATARRRHPLRTHSLTMVEATPVPRDNPEDWPRGARFGSPSPLWTAVVTYRCPHEHPTRSSRPWATRASRPTAGTWWGDQASAPHPQRVLPAVRCPIGTAHPRQLPRRAQSGDHWDRGRPGLHRMDPRARPPWPVRRTRTDVPRPRSCSTVVHWNCAPPPARGWRSSCTALSWSSCRHSPAFRSRSSIPMRMA